MSILEWTTQDNYDGNINTRYYCSKNNVTWVIEPVVRNDSVQYKVSSAPDDKIVSPYYRSLTEAKTACELADSKLSGVDA